MKHRKSIRRKKGQAGLLRRETSVIRRFFNPRYERLEDRSLLSANSWTALGPAPISNGQTAGSLSVSGRITGIAADPTDVNTVFIASAGGGVWKTTDATDASPIWTPLTDNLTDNSGNPLPMFMGSIAETRDGRNNEIVYAGTGEANGLNGFQDTFYGEGILVSKNGGATWTLTDAGGAFDRKAVGKIVIDPSDSTGASAYAAISDKATNGTSGNTGIWKTTDFGQTWTNITSANGLSTADPWSDVVIDPHTPSTLYAAEGNANGASGNGVYKSTDGGATWTLLNGFGSVNGTQDGRITLALYDDGTTNELFVSISNPTSGSSFGNLYKMLESKDGGATFFDLTSIVLATSNYFSAQGWYDTTLAVDPNDPNYVYAAGAMTNQGPTFSGSPLESFNGGGLWDNLGTDRAGNGPHSDAHAVAFDAAGNILDGDDGGIFKLTAPTNLINQRWSSLNGNLGITQFTGIAVDPTNANVVYGGSQDNGTEEYTGTATWNHILAGDGGMVRVDPTNPSVVYAEQFDASLYVSIDAGTTFNSITSGLLGHNVNFYVPYALDSSGNIYYGADYLNFSSNEGITWSAIGTAKVNGFNPNDNTIDAIAVSPSHNNVVYVSAGGQIFVTKNAQAGGSNVTWAEIDLPNGASTFGHGGWGQDALAIDPSDSTGGTAYAVVPSFTGGGNHVFKTTNFGAAWTDISANMPFDTPCNAVAVSSDGKTVYVGTDVGVYSTSDGGTTWTRFGTGMPNVRVTDLEYMSGLGILAAATHGRGAYEIPVISTAPLSYSAGSGGNYTLKLASGTLEVLDSSGNIVAQTSDIADAGSFTNNTGSAITLTIDYSGGDPLPSGGFTFTGGGGDTLDVTGYNTTTITETLTNSNSGMVQVGSGGTINYSGLSPVLINGGTVTNMIYTLPANAHAVLQDKGGTPELLSTDSPVAFENTTFAAPTGSLTINGAGGDTITTDPTFTNDYHASLAISGTATDTVNLNALTLNSGTADLTVSGQTINVENSVTATGTISLDASSALSQAAGTITATGLSVQSGTGMTLNTAASNLAFANSTSGDVDITNSGALTVSAVGGLINSTNSAIGGTITLTDDNSITVGGGSGVKSTNGDLTLAATGLTLTGTVNSGTARTILTTSTSGGAIDLGTKTAGTLGLTSADVDNVIASVLQIGNSAAGGINVSAAIDPTGTNVLTLVNGSTVTEMAAGSLKIADLRVSSTGPVTLNNANSVGALAADTTNAFSFGNGANMLTIGVVDGDMGIQTTNSDITLSAGTTTINQMLNAGTGTVNLTSGTFQLESGTGGNALADTSELAVKSPAVLDMNGQNESIDGLSGDGTITNSAAATTSVLTLGVSGGGGTFAGGINDGSGTMALTKDGAGTETLSGTNSYSGATTVSDGKLLVDGSTVAASAVTVQSGGTLGGKGSASGTVTVDSGGGLSPGDAPAILNTGSLSLTSGASFDAAIGGNSAGSYSQDNVTGTVSLGGATLNLSAFGGYVPQPGDEYILINNDGSDAVSGTFAGLAEGALVSSNFLGSGLSAYLTYQGGDGNDVAIVVTGPFNVTSPGGTLTLAESGGNVQLRSGATVLDSRPLAAVTSVTIDGAAGVANTLNIDYSGGTFVIAGGITFNGGTLPATPSNTLNILGGSFDTDTYTYTGAHAGSVQLGTSGQVIDYTNLTPIVNTGTATDVKFVLPGGAQTVLDYSGGNIVLDSTNSTLESTTIALPSNSLTIDDSVGGSTITTTAAFSTNYHGGLTIDDTTGTDTVDLTAPLDLNAGAADLAITAKTIEIGGNITTTNDQSYTGATKLAATATLSTGAAGTIGFNGTLDTDGTVHDLTVDSSSTTLAGEVGVGGPFGTLTFDGATSGTGTTNINTDKVLASTIVFANAVELQATSNVKGTTAVTFDSTLNTNGTAHDLEVDSASSTFKGEVGMVPGHALGTLTVDGITPGSGQAFIDTDQMQAAQLNFNNAVTLQMSTTLTATNVTSAKTVDGAFALHVANSGTATFDGAVGTTAANYLTSLIIDGPSDLNGLSVNTTGNQTYTGAVTLSANTALTSTTAGAILFSSTVVGPFSLHTSTTGTTTFDGAVGTTAANYLTSLIIDGPSDLNGLAVNTTGNQTYTGAVTLLANTALTSTTAGAILFSSTVVGPFGLHTSTSGTTTFDGAVGTAAANYLTSLTIDGPSDLNGLSVNTTGNQTYTGAVTLSANDVLTSTTAGPILFSSTVAGPFSLHTSTTGTTTFDGAVGTAAANYLTSLTIDGASDLNGLSVNTTGNQTYTGALTLSANAALTSTMAGAILFSSTVVGPFSLHTSTTGTTTFDGAVGTAAANYLTSLTIDGPSDLNGLSVNIIGNQTYTGAVTLSANTALTSTTVGAILFSSTVVGPFSLHTSTTGTTTFDGAVGTAAANYLTSLTIDGPSDLNGLTVNTTGNQTYTGAVTLSADTALTSTTVGAILFSSTVVGPFSLHTSTTGTTTFDGAAGTAAANYLTSLTIDGPSDLNGLAVNTTGNQTYTGAVTLSANTALTSTTAGAILFSSAVVGPFSLHTSTTGTTTFDGAVGTAAANYLTSLTIDGPSDLNGLSVNTTGNQTYTGAVTLSANDVLTSTTAGAVLFSSTVVGPFSLHTSTTGTTTFDGAVGTAAANYLTSLTIDGPSELNGLAVNTTGNQTYTGAVTLSANTALTSAMAGAILFSNTVVGPFSLHTSTTGTTTFDGAVGTAAANYLTSLTIDGPSDLNGLSVNTTGNQTYTGAVTLSTNTALTSTTAGAILFSSTVVGPFSLHTSTTGTTTFDGAVGTAAANYLTSLTIDGPSDLNGLAVNTTGNQTYTGAVTLAANTALTSTTAGAILFSSTVTGPFSLHTSTTGTTTFDGAVGTAAANYLTSLTINGPSDLNGLAVNTIGNQTYTGAVTLTANTALTSTAAGAILFSSTVVGPFSLHTSTSGTTTFDGAVGTAAANYLTNLTIDGPSDLNGLSVNTTGNQTYTGAATLSANTALTSTTAGAIFFSSTVVGPFSLHTSTTGITTFDGAVGTAAANYLTSLAIDGPSDLNGLSVNTTGNQTYTGAVTLSANTTLTSTAAGAILFSSTVVGPFSLHTSTTGTTTFDGAVGTAAANYLTSLIIDGPSDLNGLAVNTTGNQTYTGAVTLSANTALTSTTAGAILFSSTVVGPFSLHTSTTGTSTFDGAVGTAAANYLTSLTIDGPSDLNGLAVNTTGNQTYTGAVTLSANTALTSTTAGAIVFSSTVVGPFSLHTSTTGTTTFDGAVGTAAANYLTSLTIDGPSDLNGLAVNTTGNQTYTGAVTLSADTALTSTTGGAILFGSTVVGPFSLHTSTTGTTTFDGAVGTAAANYLTSLIIDGPSDLNGLAVNTTGNQTYTGAVTLSANTALTSTTAGAILFSSTVVGPFSLHTSTTGTTTFHGAVGTAAANYLKSLTIDGPSDLNGLSVNTTGNQTYTGAVTLSADTALTSTTAGAILFSSTVVGPFSLQTSTTGTTTFDGAVGTTAANYLTSLTIDGPSDLNGLTVNTTGNQTYTGAATLSGNAALTSTTAGAILFGSTVVGPFSLHTSTTGTTTFDGAVGTAAANFLTSLTIDGRSDLNGLAVNTTGNQTYTGAVTLSANAALTSTTAGAILFSSTVVGPFSLHTSTTGTTTFDGAVATAAANYLTSLTIDGPSDLNGLAVNTTGNQTYTGAVTLSANTALTSTTAGAILFGSTVVGPFSLHTSTTGTTTFDGAVSTAAANYLTGLTIDGPSDLKGLSVNTTGNQTYSGAVTLSANAALATFNDNANVTFGSTVDAATAGGAALSIDTSGGRVFGNFGTVTFKGNVGGTNPLSALTVNSGPFTLGPGIDLTTTGDVLVTVAEKLPNVAGDDIDLTGAKLTSTTGNIDLRAGDNISIDSGSTVAAGAGTVTLEGDVNNNDSPAGTTINLDGVIKSPTINVNGGSGNDTINIQQTQAGTTTNVTETAGTNTINVSSTAGNAAAGTVANIAGTINVKGSGNDTLNLDDRADASSTAGALTSSAITGLGMAGTINYSGLSQANVKLGSNAGLAFNVQSTAGTTPVTVTGLGSGTVNVGDTSNTLDNIAATLTIDKVLAINLNDQGSSKSDSIDAAGNAVETYNITNTAVGRGVPGQFPKVLVIYQDMAPGSLQVNGSTHVNNDFNVFLPTPNETQFTNTLKTLKLNGGATAGNFPNTVKVVAPQENSVVPAQTSNQFVYTASVGVFGSADPIQTQNVQALDMYGSPVYSNNFENDTNATSVMIGGSNFDTLRGGSGVDVLFGGGTPQTNPNPANPLPPELLSAGGAAGGLPGSGGQDYVFVDYRPQFNANGSVSYVPFPGNGSLIHVDGGGGSVVSLEPSTTINGAGSVVQVNGIIDTITWLTARFASPSSAGSILNQALTSDPVLATLQAPPAGPQPLPVAGSSASAADLTYITDVYKAVLGRAPTAADLTFWGDQLAAGLSHLAFATSLTHSAEYYQVKVIEPAYVNYLGRAADAAGLAYWTAQMQAGLTDEQLEAGFIASAEFYAKAGGTDAGWVNALYQSLLGRPADASGLSYWVGQLAAGESRANVALGFTGSPEREAERVTNDYMTYLGRTPDQAGLNYWVSEFTQGLMTNEDVIAGFVGSDEYFASHS